MVKYESEVVSVLRRLLLKDTKDAKGPKNWARSCENVSYANNKGADQRAHPCSLIRTFIVCCLDSMICILAISKVPRF